MLTIFWIAAEISAFSDEGDFVKMSEFNDHQDGQFNQPYGNQQQQNYMPQDYQPHIEQVQQVQLAQSAQSGVANAAAETDADNSRKTTGLILGIVGCVAAVALVSFISIMAYRAITGDGSTVRSRKYSDFSLNEGETPQTDTSIKNGDTELTAAQIAAKVRPSIVGVTTNDNVSYDSAESGEGSGIIVDSDGYIITNSHVIGNSKKYDVSVTIQDGTTYKAKVMGYDERSDLAVLKIEAKGLSACEFGDSTKLVPGDYVVAIGNPGGLQFAGSVTDGIVSGIDRIIDTTDMDSTSAMRYIQTNAVVNPGNSGGALVNVYGQVVGVNTSKISAPYYEAMSFAIPSSTVREVIADLIDYGYVQGRVKLGITCLTIPNTYEKQGIPAGLQIKEINSDSDLNGKAQPYDIITHCDGKRVETLSQLQDVMFEKKPGDTIRLKLYRPASSLNPSKEYTVTVKLLEDTGSSD